MDCSSSKKQNSFAFQVPGVWAHIPKGLRALPWEIQTTGMALELGPCQRTLDQV